MHEVRWTLYVIANNFVVLNIINNFLGFYFQQAACSATAAVLHYIFLVVFCIMLVEGTEIAITVLYVFKRKRSRIKLMLILAWGKLFLSWVLFIYFFFFIFHSCCILWISGWFSRSNFKIQGHFIICQFAWMCFCPCMRPACMTADTDV